MNNLIKSIATLAAIMFIFSPKLAQAQHQTKLAEARQYKHAISVELLPFLIGDFAVKYEQKLNERWSVVSKAGIIGLFPPRAFEVPPFYSFYGNKSFREEIDDYSVRWEDNIAYEGITNLKYDDSHERGFYLRVGPKSLLQKQKKFLGFYAHPSVSYTYYGSTSHHQYSFQALDGSFPFGEPEDKTIKSRTHSIGTLLSLGLQLQFAKGIVLDLNGGIGFAYTIENFRIENHLATDGENPISKIRKSTYNDNHHSHLSANNPGGIALNLGVSIGKAF